METSKHILIIFLFFTVISHSQERFNDQVASKIYTESYGSFVDVTGFGINKTESLQAIKYKLSIIEKNKDSLQPTSKEDVEGQIVLQPIEKKEICRSGVNIGEGKRTIILLLIYDEDDKIIGQDRIVLNGGEEEKKEIEPKQTNESQDLTKDGDDGVFFRGMVFEDVKTKIGRDFFKSYSQEYDNKKINGEQPVTVNEVLALGTNTKIEIEIGGEIIFQFFVNPRADFIDTMAEVAIARTERYFFLLKKNRNSLKSY